MCENRIETEQERREAAARARAEAARQGRDVPPADTREQGMVTRAEDPEDQA